MITLLRTIPNRLMRVFRSLVIKRKQGDLGSRLLADHIAVTTGLMDKPMTEQELKAVELHQAMHRLVRGINPSESTHESTHVNSTHVN